MCLREFAERIPYKWQVDKDVSAEPIDAQCKRKFKTRDVNSGHWILSFYRQRQHIRSSIRLFTKPAIEYEPIDVDECTSPTAFHDQPREKTQQLSRAYQQMTFYVPWTISPDESFLTDERTGLNDDPERERRYSMHRLQLFFNVYRAKWNESLGPDANQSIDTQTRKRNELWFRDNQYSYSMYLANEHNTDIHLDRLSNKGVLSATYDDADELCGTEVSIRPALYDENDDAEYPSMLNFCLPVDGFQDVLKQPIPDLSELCVST